MGNGYAKYSGLSGAGGGGGSGITSINGDSTAAQVITGGTGISVASSGGTTTITNTGAGSGTVISVGLTDGSTTPIYGISGTPVTSAGTLDFALVTQPANSIFAGPSNGADAQPTFRAQLLNDLPIISNNRILGNNTGSTNHPVTIGTGTVTEATSNILTLTGWTNATLGSPTIQVAQATTFADGYLSTTDWNTFNSKQSSGNYITTLTGDGMASGPNSAAFTLATVNSNTGAFGSSTSIPTFTVNAKGLITAASGNVVIAPAGTLSGTTLNATVVSSSLTSVGTIATGTWQGTIVGKTFGGTGISSTATFPSSGTVVTETGTETLTNKTLTSPQVNGLSLDKAAKTGAYTLLVTDDVVTGDATSGAFTFTLPVATGDLGKVFWIKKIDSTFSAITCTDGTFSTTLNTQGEAIEIQSDGTTYQILNRYVPSVWTSCTITISNWTNVTNITGFYKRIGDSASIRVHADVSGGNSGSLVVNIPFTISTAKLPNGTTNPNAKILGYGDYWRNSASQGNGLALIYTSTTSLTASYTSSNGASPNPAPYNTNIVTNIGTGSGDYFDFYIDTIPVSGWNG